MAFSQMVDAQIGVLRHGEQFDVFALHPNRGKKTCDLAECQYVEKQHLPLALNQL